MRNSVLDLVAGTQLLKNLLTMGFLGFNRKGTHIAIVWRDDARRRIR